MPNLLELVDGLFAASNYPNNLSKSFLSTRNNHLIIYYVLVLFNAEFFPIHFRIKTKLLACMICILTCFLCLQHSTVKYDMQNLETPIIPVLGALVKSGIRVLVYR